MWIRVRVRLADIILPGLRSSQECNKTFLFQLLNELDEIFSTTEVREGYDLLFSFVVFIHKTKESFLREGPLDSDDDGGYRELSIEERCCHLSPKYTVGVARMVCEDDHIFTMAYLAGGFNERLLRETVEEINEALVSS